MQGENAEWENYPRFSTLQAVFFVNSILASCIAMEHQMQPIIKNMPIPPLRRRGAKAKYPWATIQPGQAFKFDESASLSGATSLAYQSGRQHRMKFAVRQMDDGIWCWRVDGTPYEVVNGNYRQDSHLVDNYGETAGPAKETLVVGHQPDTDPI